MKYQVSSRIESCSRREKGMARHRKHHVEESIEPSDEKGDSLPSSPSASESRHVHHKSEAIHSGNGFFHKVKVREHGVSQITDVRVRVEPAREDDSVTGCFKAMFKCFK